MRNEHSAPERLELVASGKDGSLPGIRARVRDFLAWDDRWQRRRPEGYLRRDVVTALVTFAASALMMEASRSVGGFVSGSSHYRSPSIWLAQGAVFAACFIFVWRRRYPLATTALLGAHMVLLFRISPIAMGQFPLQALYFLAIYSGTAWARTRRLAMLVIGTIVAVMSVLIAWQYVDGSAAAEMQEYFARYHVPRPGVLDPMLASIIYSIMINGFYFGAAFLSGQVAWRNARARASLSDQADVIREQSGELQEYAVTRERLRIARELHDVVAHHVAVMGIQTGAARKMLTKDPERATGALQEVEASSREAVSELRSLLGTLRGTDGPADRTPQPGLTELGELVERTRSAGLDVTYAIHDDLGCGLDAVPAAVALTLHRITQEALTNVQRHSSATHASVVLRLASHGWRTDSTTASAGERPAEESADARARPAVLERARSAQYAEVEIVDDGRPLPDTSGSGLGQRGMRERVAAHGGILEVGPRPEGGYRVRVRLPLPAARREAP